MKTCASIVACVLAASSLAGQTGFPSLRAGGFADIELHTSSDSTREGLDLAELDGYAVVDFSKRWSALGEGLVRRSWKKPDPGEKNKIEFDVERLYVEYAQSDAIRVEIGETHTGIIRWNEREHRSRFLQTPIDVPAIARRPEDDGAWPLQFIGVWASGRTAGPMGFGYGAGFGAGSGHARDEVPVLTNDRSPCVLLSVSVAPDRVAGLDLAVAGYAQELRTRGVEYDERDVTLSGNFVRSGTEIRGEYALMNHRDTATRRLYRTTGFYVLLSKRMYGSWERVRPYFLVDHLDIASGDVYLRNSTPENAYAAGLRYDFSGRFSVKGEIRSQRAPDGDREYLAGLQIGFSF